MRRLVASLVSVAAVVGVVAVAEAATSATYTPACVDANPGGWRSTARDFAPAWYDQASLNDRTAFANYVAAANGGRTLASKLYADESICVNPDRVPSAPTTTTTAVSTSSSTTTSSTSSTTSTTQPITLPTVATTTEAPTTSSSTSTSTSSSTTAPSTTSTVPSGVCSGAAGTPGSSDGQGGCFPGPGTVGIPAGVTLTPYTGTCTITTANLTLDARDFTGCRNGLDIRANGVTISRSKIYHGVSGNEANGYAFTISDSLIDGAQAAYGGVACVNCGVDGWNWTVLRTEIIHTNRGAYCMQHCVLRDSWIHAVNLDTSPCPQASSGTCPHASAVRVEQYATLVHNTLACDFTGPFNDDLGCSADMSGYADFAPIHDNLIQNNLFRANPIGQYYCAYGGGTAKPHTNDPPGPVNIRFIDNVFERGSNGKCGTGGPITDFPSGRTGNAWSGNRWSTGEVVAAA